ncbi:MAG: glutamine--tRNA ligase/YqeY domain fusion protein [Caldilineaceae bacterium]|nr:glutamine--tRNA ligase/YqeY domain fusion protein [Caldilineaceae bacterium]
MTDTIENPTETTEPRTDEAKDFIRAVINEDMRTGKYRGEVVTRFPPEPNGYPHIGHAKSICLNFGIAEEYGGVCNLRMDDTNPETEDEEFVRALQDAVKWLGYDYGDNMYYASDYFEQLYQFAEQLILDGKAYVDSLSGDEIREYRGTVKEPGRESPYRMRSVEENLDLFRRMRAGEFPNGSHVLRAKGDMASPNMKMRDPLLYRIRHASHYRTGDAWPIYPMYDFAHPLSDAIEGITHSICTLEFENNREIYDWLGENLLEEPRPHQYEFARLNLNNTVLSKRKLRRLVEENYVAGWDDPRMPTIAGIQRRGVTPQALRDFCERIGVAKTNSRIDPALLDACIRDDLNMTAPRVMAVLRPLKVLITNYPEGETEELDASFWPRDVPKEGSRPVPFSREIYIEQDDFMEDPPKGFRRLVPGGEVRLRYAYIIKCEEVIKDAGGNVIELRCTYDPDSKGGAPKDGRKVQGTVHWVSATQGIPAEIRLYDRLFTLENPDDIDDDKSFTDFINPDSLVMVQGVVEPVLAQAKPWERFQFERQGYFVVDPVDSKPDALVFNRTVELRDSWTKSITMSDTATKQPTSSADEASVTDSNRKSKTELRSERRAQEPELVARLERYQSELGLSFEDADVLTGDLALAHFYEATLAAHDSPQSVANWVLNEVLRERKDGSIADLPFDGAALGKLVALVDNNTISTAAAKDVFADMMATGADPAAIVEKKGLQQVSDADQLKPIIEKVIAANTAKAEEYRSGKTGLFGFFMGQVMRETKGKANPQVVQELVREALK